MLKRRKPETVASCTLQICSLHVNGHGRSQAFQLEDLGEVLDVEAEGLDSLFCRNHRWCLSYILSAHIFVVALTSERGHYGAEEKNIEEKTNAN